MTFISIFLLKLIIHLLTKVYSKELHRIYLENTTNEDVDVKLSSTWLKYARIPASLEGNLCALQDRNSTYNVINQKCQICKTSKMSTDHLATRCKRFLNNKYTIRHDNVIRTILFNILKIYKITNKKRIRNFNLRTEYANNVVDIRVDNHFKTECNIKFNKPDLMVIDKVNKVIKIIEIAVTNTVDLVKIENHKTHKYQQLKNYLSSAYQNQ